MRLFQKEKKKNEVRSPSKGDLVQFRNEGWYPVAEPRYDSPQNSFESLGGPGGEFKMEYIRFSDIYKIIGFGMVGNIWGVYLISWRQRRMIVLGIGKDTLRFPDYIRFREEESEEEDGADDSIPGWGDDHLIQHRERDLQDSLPEGRSCR